MRSNKASSLWVHFPPHLVSVVDQKVKVGVDGHAAILAEHHLHVHGLSDEDLVWLPGETHFENWSVLFEILFENLKKIDFKIATLKLFAMTANLIYLRLQMFVTNGPKNTKPIYSWDIIVRSI